MSPERMRRLLLNLSRLDAALDLPDVREMTGHVEAMLAFIREVAPALPPEQQQRARQLAPPI